MNIALIILSIIAIFLVLTGRLTNAKNAVLGQSLEPVNHPSGSGSLTQQNGATKEEYTGNPIVGSGYIPTPNLFGLKAQQVTSMFQVPKALGQWGQNIVKADGGLFGHPAVMEWNYLFPTSSVFPIKAPGTSKDIYTVIENKHDPSINGIVVLRSNQNHGLIAFLHFSSLQGFQPGATIHGGETIGYSGWPLGAANAAGGIVGPRNAHLAVAVDRLGWDWLKHYE